MIKDLVISRIGRDERDEVVFVELTLFDYKGSKIGTLNVSGDLFPKDLTHHKSVAFVSKVKFEELNKE